MLSKKCIRCGREFTRNPKIGKTRWKERIKFCSRLCANRSNTENGKTGFFKGHPGYVKDYSFHKPMTEEQRKKRSESNKNNPKLLKHIEELGRNHRGANHWNWKGGITEKDRAERMTKVYDVWRKSVYARDSWTCRKCGVKCKSETIVAHHKKAWKDHIELRYEVSNGMTLCRKCHKKVHKNIGLKTRFK